MTIEWLGIGEATVKVVLVGIIFGAGLPTLFGIGMRLWDIGEGGEHADGTATPGRPVALIGSYAIFAAVAAVIVYGVLFIAARSIQHYLGITVPT